jgi:diacylglycerol O-acyltransferase
MGNSRIHVPVSAIDTTWLGMDESTNPMIVNCIMFLSQRVDYQRLLETLDRRLIARYNRFSQRIVDGLPVVGNLQWESDPHFDIRSHVHHLALPEPGGQAELKQLVSMLMSEPLDRTRPLWRIYLISNLGDGCAVYGRIHHAIGDGLGLMQVVLSLTDPEPSGPNARSEHAPAATSTPRSSGLVRSPLRLAARAAATMVDAVSKRKADPLGARQDVKDALGALSLGGKIAAATSLDLARLLLMPPDRVSPYRGKLTPIKRVAWSRPLPLERVKSVGKASGATVNDVLTAAVSLGLRNYMTVVDRAVPHDDIRAAVPINLRQNDAPPTLGNKFGFVFLTLPTSIADPLECLHETKKRMQALKGSTEPQLIYEILSLMGILPGAISRPLTAWFAAKVTCLLTNVPGPRRPVYFVGNRVDRMLFWVPQSRSVGLGISIFSYAGDVTIGIMVDDALVPEPEHVVANISSAFEAIESAVGRQRS